MSDTIKRVYIIISNSNRNPYYKEIITLVKENNMLFDGYWGMLDKYLVR
jgi:hypothetical protein